MRSLKSSFGISIADSSEGPSERVLLAKRRAPPALPIVDFFLSSAEDNSQGDAFRILTQLLRAGLSGAMDL